MDGINDANEEGFTILMLSVMRKEKEKAKALIEEGANVDARNHCGDTALIISVKNGDEDMTGILIESGADVNLTDYNCNAPLIFAARREEYLYTVRLLLTKGAEVNKKNCLNRTPLHEAAYVGAYDTVKLLIAMGADVNGKDRNRETPLHKATRYGWEDIAELLIEAGARLDARNCFDETPLHTAMRGNWIATADILIACGANPNGCDDTARGAGYGFGNAFVLTESAEIKAAASEYRAFADRLAEELRNGYPKRLFGL
jgi:ankyrin repeat protein